MASRAACSVACSAFSSRTASRRTNGRRALSRPEAIAVSTAFSAVGAMRWPVGVVAVHAVHHPRAPAGRNAAACPFGDVLRHAAVGRGHLDVGDRLTAGVGRHELDAQRRIGVPVNRAARARRAPRPADLHPQHRRRTRCSPRRRRTRACANDLAMVARGDVTTAADFTGRRHVLAPGGMGRGYSWSRRGASCRTPASLACTNASRLRRYGRSRRPPGRATRLPRGKLRVHRRVARLAAELRRLHPVERAIAGDQKDGDVDRREADDARTVRRTRTMPEVDDRPVGDRRPAGS